MVGAGDSSCDLSSLLLGRRSIMMGFIGPHSRYLLRPACDRKMARAGCFRCFCVLSVLVFIHQCYPECLLVGTRPLGAGTRPHTYTCCLLETYISYTPPWPHVPAVFACLAVRSCLQISRSCPFKIFCIICLSMMDLILSSHRGVAS